jgi:hypothetical protein
MAAVTVGPLGGELSTLPFRLLCQRHGAAFATSNLLRPDVFVKVARYREAQLPALKTRGLIAQVNRTPCHPTPDSPHWRLLVCGLG